MKFQTFVKTGVGHRLDQVQCRNTIDDDFSFTEEEIFVGYLPNEFDEMSDESGSAREGTIIFSEERLKNRALRIQIRF